MALSMQMMDDAEFGEARWRQLHAFLAGMSARGLGNAPPEMWEALRDRVLAHLAEEDGFRDWAILDGGEIKGWLSVHVRAKGVSESGEAIPAVAVLHYNFDLEFDVRRVATTAARHVSEVMRKHACAEAFFISLHEHQHALPKAWGGKMLNRVLKYRLEREKANRVEIERWLREYPARFPELQLEIFTEIPEEHLDRWIELYRQCLEEMPTEGPQGTKFTMSREEVRRSEALRRKNRQNLYTAALFDGTGTMIGHSNTAAVNYPPVEWFQAMTGLDRAWRGKGLSRWLKAALFVRTGEDFPEGRRIFTEMRAVNEPIMAVNRQMGYELASEGYEWSIGREELEGV